MGESVAFYILSACVLVGAISVIWSRSPMTSLLSLLIAMFGVAGIFVLLHAYFLAAIQLLIYAGAVLILFLFVLMLLRLDENTLKYAQQFSGRFSAVAFGLLLAAHILWIVGASVVRETTAPPVDEAAGTVAAVGRLLFTDYLLPFELTSLLILAAIVGIVALAQRKTHDT
jgi:NADH-quinone oxidoreductase subunit J